MERSVFYKRVNWGKSCHLVKLFRWKELPTIGTWWWWVSRSFSRKSFKTGNVLTIQVGCLNVLLSLLCLPWMHAVLPHSPLHVSSHCCRWRCCCTSCSWMAIGIVVGYLHVCACTGCQCFDLRFCEVTDSWLMLFMFLFYDFCLFVWSNFWQCLCSYNCCHFLSSKIMASSLFRLSSNYLDQVRALADIDEHVEEGHVYDIIVKVFLEAISLKLVLKL